MSSLLVTLVLKVSTLSVNPVLLSMPSLLPLLKTATTFPRTSRPLVLITISSTLLPTMIPSSPTALLSMLTRLVPMLVKPVLLLPLTLPSAARLPSFKEVLVPSLTRSTMLFLLVPLVSSSTTMLLVPSLPLSLASLFPSSPSPTLTVRLS